MDNNNIVSKYGENCFELKGPKMGNILPLTHIFSVLRGRPFNSQGYFEKK